MEPNVRGSHTPSKDPLRSLYSILVTRPALSGGDLSPFIDFLAHRAAVGNRVSSLGVDGFPDVGAGVVGGVSRVVEVFGEVENHDYDYVCY